MLGSSQNKDIKEPQHRNVLWLVFVGYKEGHTDGRLQMFQMRPGRGKAPWKKRSVFCSLFPAPGNDFLPQYKEGSNDTGQKHGSKAVEYHGRHRFALRQETAE